VEKETQSQEVEKLLQTASDTLAATQWDNMDEFEQAVLRSNERFVKRLALDKLKWVKESHPDISDEDMQLATEYLMAQIAARANLILEKKAAQKTAQKQGEKLSENDEVTKDPERSV